MNFVTYFIMTNDMTGQHELKKIGNIVLSNINYCKKAKKNIYLLSIYFRC